MKETKKRYWKGLEELNNDPEYLKLKDKEFPEYLPTNGSSDSQWDRRDFLKLMGFSLTAATLAACETPVRKAIPYLNKPVNVDPGIANYYASTYQEGGDYCSIVVKTREGRPIKINGNKLSTINNGSVTAQVEASVLSLYDTERLDGPRKGNTDLNWSELDSEIIAQLNQISAAGGLIRIVSNTILSPATKEVIEIFKTKYPSTLHVVYDTRSYHGIRKGNMASFATDTMPAYDFSKANVIVSFDADFLGTWLSPAEFSGQYSKNRKLGPNKKSMSRHFHFESNMSLTGANADYRGKMKPSQHGLAVATLYNMIAAKTGAAAANVPAVDIPFLQKAATDLWNNRTKSLVVSGSNDYAVQVLVNAINDLLGNYGKTLDLTKPINLAQGNDESMDAFISEAKSGSISAAIFLNCNPVYDHPRGSELGSSLANISLTVSTSDRRNELTSLVGYCAPDNHFLESWNDAEPGKGHYSLAQPTITPIFYTRQAQETLLKWAGNEMTDYLEFLQNSWKTKFYPNANDSIGFQIFWDKTLVDGVMVVISEETLEQPAFSADFASVETALNQNYKKDNSGWELSIYQKVGMGSGSMANNPFLHELPDPVTKVTWDNYVTVSQSDAAELGIEMDGDRTTKVNLNVSNISLSVPALIQPGQAKGTLGLSLGYGRTAAGRVGNGLGVNAYPLVKLLNGTLAYTISSGVQISNTEEEHRIARTQTHQTYMNRNFVVQEAKLSEYQSDPLAGRHVPKIKTWSDPNHEKEPEAITLWKGHKYTNHHWGLIVDMNSCTGCSACVVACNVENNIPVVGKDEVLNRREMHWLRIDRYYSSDAADDDQYALEEASENPEVTFQPMMCQHCNNAPCETVCPVAATTHSTEGLNQMAYNRCIGTRYCANNCPYKVRRFNWFKYHDNRQFSGVNTTMNTDLGKMVLNPDVVVRSRGVMEKCSMCVQRIQDGKLKAKKEGRRTTDEDINTACADACPTHAITFGDMLEKESLISKMLRIEYNEDGTVKGAQEERAYHVLEEVGVRSNVHYLTKIRNKDIEEENV